MFPDHIFVYGSLQKEFSSPARTVLDNYAEFAGEAVFQGKLYRIDWYPGVVESDKPGDIVYGEVYRIKNREIVLAKLDRYEGCSPDDPEPHEFSREELTIRLQTGEKIMAWVFLYKGSLKGKSRIYSGLYAGNNQEMD